MDDLFDIYLNELVEWNKKFNLTSITDPTDIKIKHFADSLSLAEVVSFTNQKVVDIGTGAGFPGIPLKIKYPDISLTLIEATRKKTEFLKHIVKILNLRNVDIIWGRAEEIANGHREYFDLAVSRAVAQLNKLSEICLPFVKVNGLFIAQKNADCEKEVKEANRAIKLLGGKLADINKIELSPDIQHALVIIKKVSCTPSQYPRPTQEILKSPL